MAVSILALSASPCSAALPKGEPLAKPYTSQLNRKLQSQPYRKASPGRGKLSRNAVTRLMRAHRQLLLTRTLIRRCAPPSPQGVKALAAAGKLPGKEQSLQARQRLPLRGSWQNRQVLTEGVHAKKPCTLFFRECTALEVYAFTSRCGSHRGCSSASSSCQRTFPRCRTQPPSPARS